MTTPYVTGTVSVTAGSAIVTGVGTGWQTAGLVAGQFGLDSANGNPIPVLSVDSDTQITLAKPWRGTTASGQAYWITYDTQPGQQTVANAQMLALYLSRLDKPALAALASLTPAADKLPYFGANGAGVLADFNAAARALLAGGVLVDGQLPARLRSTALSVGTAANALDAISESGWVSVNDSAVVTVNGPPVGGRGGICFTLIFGTSNAFQMYNNVLGTPRQFFRYKAGGVWSLWDASISTDTIMPLEQGFAVRGRITTNGIPADANNILRPGIYYAQITADATVANNFPVSGIGILEVTYALDPGNANAPRINQRWTTVNFTTGPDTYTSSVYNVSGTTTYGPWVKNFHSRNILGTVSQASGVPTGTIIERGSNANGEYVRFADGTQICTYAVSASVTTTAYGNVFRDTTNVPSWTYPVAFSGTVSVFSSISGAGAWVNIGSFSTTVAGSIAVFSGTALSGTSLALRLCAIGRWF